MQKDLIKRHQDIEANEDKDTDLEMRHYNSDENCLRAGFHLLFLQLTFI